MLTRGLCVQPFACIVMHNSPCHSASCAVSREPLLSWERRNNPGSVQDLDERFVCAAVCLHSTICQPAHCAEWLGSPCWLERETTFLALSFETGNAGTVRVHFNTQEWKVFGTCLSKRFTRAFTRASANGFWSNHSKTFFLENPTYANLDGICNIFIFWLFKSIVAVIYFCKQANFWR